MTQPLNGSNGHNPQADPVEPELQIAIGGAVIQGPDGKQLIYIEFVEGAHRHGMAMPIVNALRFGDGVKQIMATLIEQARRAASGLVLPDAPGVNGLVLGQPGQIPPRPGTTDGGIRG